MQLSSSYWNSYSKSRMQADLGAAARSDNLQACRDLIAEGVDVDGPLDYDGNTALMVAAGHGHTALVQALLAAGANVHAENNGRTALFMAARRIDADVVQVLLEAGAGAKATEALREAVQSIHKEFALLRPGYPYRSAVVSMLVAAGADVNQEAAFNQPAFLEACCSGDLDIVQPMLQYSNDECLVQGVFTAVYNRFSSLATLLLHEIASRDLGAAQVVAPFMESWDQIFLSEDVMKAWLEAMAHTDAQLAAVTEQQRELAAVASSIPHVVISLEAQGMAGRPTSTSPEADQELAGEVNGPSMHEEQQ